MSFSSIKKTIEEGGLELALSDLAILIKKQFSAYENDIIHLNAKYNHLKKEELLGIADEPKKEWNKINYAVLQLISLIESSLPVHEPASLRGFICVGFGSDGKKSTYYSVNNHENEKIYADNELVKDRVYITKPLNGIHLRAYLPPLDGYSMKRITESEIIGKLHQCTKIRLINTVYEFSTNACWAYVEVL